MTLTVAATVQAQRPSAISTTSSSVPKVMVVPLSGSGEIPPMVSNSSGLAIFWYNASSEQMSYLLFVSNLQNPTSAQIEINNGSNNNGSAVVQLYPTSQFVLSSGSKSGVLAIGNIAAGDLSGPLAGRPMSELIGQITNGSAFVNIRTLGFPNGELRGNINITGQSPSDILSAIQGMGTSTAGIAPTSPPTTGSPYTVPPHVPG